MKPIFVLPLLLALAACGARKPTTANPVPTDGPGWTGLSRPMDIIHARSEVMEHMELLMEAIDTIQVEPVRNVDQLHLQALAISAMLQAVPHLFPPTTNIYNPAGPEFPTLALPAIWQNFDTFYKLAMSASQAAEDFADTTGDDALRAASLKLRNSCDACHKLFQRPFMESKPGPEDYKFDFDSAIAKDTK